MESKGEHIGYPEICKFYKYDCYIFDKKTKALESAYLPIFLGRALCNSIHCVPNLGINHTFEIYYGCHDRSTISHPILPSSRPSVPSYKDKYHPPPLLLPHQPTNQPIKSPPSQSNSTILPPPAFTLIITIIIMTITMTIPTNNPTTTQSTPRTIPRRISHKHISVAIATFRCPKTKGFLV